MPIDPRIALAAQSPQMQDPFESYARVMSLKNIIGQGQLQQQEMQANEMKTAELMRRLQVNRMAHDVLGKHRGNLEQALPELTQILDPDELDAYVKLQKSKEDMSEQDRLRYRQGVDFLRGQIYKIFSAPEETRDSLYQQVKAGLPPQLLEHLPDRFNAALLAGYDDQLKREQESTESAAKKAALRTAELNAYAAEQKVTGTQPMSPYDKARLEQDAYGKTKPTPTDVFKQQLQLRTAATNARMAASGGSETPTPGYTVGGPSVANPSKDLTVETGAWDYLTSGKIPFIGMTGGSKVGGKTVRERMIGRAGEILADLGFTPAELPAMRGQIKANSSALQRVTGIGALVQQFEKTVEKNMQTAVKLSEKWNRTNFPFANRLIAAWKTGTGDSEALNFVAQMHAVANEWAKVMQGAASVSGATVSSSKDAEAIMDKYLSNGQVQSLFNDVIIPDMTNRSAAIEEEKQALVGAIRGNTTTRNPSSGKTYKAGDNPAGLRLP